MERSDKYIEELEAELDEYRGTSSGKSAASKHDKYLTNGDVASRKVYSDSKVSQFSSQRAATDNTSRRQLFSDDKEGKSATGEKSKYYYDQSSDSKARRELRDEYSDYTSDRSATKSQSAKNSVPNNGKKRVTFDLEKNTNATTSFDLELPSPLKGSGNRSAQSNGRASPVKGVLKKTGGKGSSDDKSMDSYNELSRTADDSDTFTSRYTSSRQSKDDDLVYVKSRSSGREYSTDDLYSKSKKKYSADDSFLSEPSSMEVKSLSDLEYGSRRSGDKQTNDYSRKSSDYDTRRRDGSRDRDDELSREDLEDTQFIESELDELNISLTPEFTDCMKLLNRAEKKVNTHDTSDEEDTLSRYKTNQDKDYDTAFRASTGSIGYKRPDDDLRASTGSYGYKTATSNTEHPASGYRSDLATSHFASSLDSYSRGRHVRTGSLDNIYIERPVGQEERPGSALPSASNMFSSSGQSKYSTGLTTGRTTLTRTPSFDNLLMSRPGASSLLTRPSFQGVPSIRSYRGENDDKLDVNANINLGVGSTSTASQKPVTALHGILGETGADRHREESPVTFDAVLQARARSLSDMGTSKTDLDRKLPPTGRLTPTLQGTSTSGRVTPTIPSHSEFMTLQKLSSDKYSISTSSGRTTPTFTSNTNYDALTKTNPQFTDYKSSSTVDMSLKPPSGVTVRQPDIPSTTLSYLTAPMSSYANPAPSSGFASLPLYNSTAGGGKFDSGPMSAPYSDTRYSEVSKSDFDFDKFNVGSRTSVAGSTAQPLYNADDKMSSLKTYNDRNFDSGFTNYTSKASGSHVSMSLPSSDNPSSALFTGPSSSSISSSLGLGSSYSAAPYLPTSLSTVPTISAYSTALSVPLTHTTSSYTSSVPANTFTSKSLDPIAESNHFSYVSNASGDYSSKNDTFGLPEPKKRLFDDSEDMNLSVSPIKSNRKF